LFVSGTSTETHGSVPNREARPNLPADLISTVGGALSSNPIIWINSASDTRCESGTTGYNVERMYCPSLNSYFTIKSEATSAGNV
jgi:hypothetical protein